MGKRAPTCISGAERKLRSQENATVGDWRDTDSVRRAGRRYDSKVKGARIEPGHYKVNTFETAIFAIHLRIGGCDLPWRMSSGS